MAELNPIRQFPMREIVPGSALGQELLSGFADFARPILMQDEMMTAMIEYFDNAKDGVMDTQALASKLKEIQKKYTFK